MAIRRHDCTFLIQVAGFFGNLDAHPARERHVAFTVQETLARQVNRDERSGTCCLYRHTRTLQIELVGHQSRQEILVTAEHYLIGADRLDQCTIRTEVNEQITADALACINTDSAFEGNRRIA